MTGVLLGSYIIGSVARGEDDERSDLDILALVQDGHGKVDETAIIENIPAVYLNHDIGISWYGVNRITQMFEDGDLFAWHVWAEHIILEQNDFSLSAMGPPQKYQNAFLDIESFQRILDHIPLRVKRYPHNAVYELGLIYVCVRNIAMSASGELQDRPDFSRYSPYNLTNVPKLPIKREEYELAMRCRMAGQRGFCPPMDIDSGFVINIYSQVSKWIAHLKRQVIGVRNG